MQSVAKAQALVRDLADKLSKRFQNGASINSLRQANDAQGWPMLFLSVSGNEAEAQPVILIRVRNVDLVSKDIFGGSSFAYAPHTLELAYELAGANNPIPTDVDIVVAEFEAMRLGARFQLKEIANGTAVNEASLNAKAPDCDLEDLYWPTKSV